ncbi:hypothetical protein chiPu_0017972 [Chiloscyllium punctatum]|uniref:Linker for activation of T-cells family member 2 n=1 Tax=Chiloscyllium punctatum TaxID=137246 RepID=A0A401RK63_CHIPU|nr:hypothetical protein [Chiloscyllium punctatum]
MANRGVPEIAAGMNQVELWLGVLSVLPLAVLVMLCSRCRLFGNRTIIREENRKAGQSVHIISTRTNSKARTRDGEYGSLKSFTFTSSTRNPLAAEYYCFPAEYLKPPHDDDSTSYENVEIRKTESHTSVESGASYENCEYAVKWKLQQEPEEKTYMNNSEEDEEPDYINTFPCPSL